MLVHVLLKLGAQPLRRNDVIIAAVQFQPDLNKLARVQLTPTNLQLRPTRAKVETPTQQNLL